MVQNGHFPDHLKWQLPGQKELEGRTGCKLSPWELALIDIDFEVKPSKRQKIPLFPIVLQNFQLHTCVSGTNWPIFMGF